MCPLGQLVDEIKIAMINTIKIIKGTEEMFGFDSSQIPSEKQKQFQEMVATFAKTFHPNDEKLSAIAQQKSDDNGAAEDSEFKIKMAFGQKS